ncbi:MAG: hypothetical protein EXR37_09680 [Limnohabitans sp.]|nr:hypothetical protein [Limnohabitans sp.]
MKSLDLAKSPVEHRNSRPGWRRRIDQRLDQWMTSPWFYRWAISNPLTRWITRRRAAQLFDVMAGFVHSCRIQVHTSRPYRPPTKTIFSESMFVRMRILRRAGQWTGVMALAPTPAQGASHGLAESCRHRCRHGRPGQWFATHQRRIAGDGD